MTDAESSEECTKPTPLDFGARKALSPSFNHQMSPRHTPCELTTYWAISTLTSATSLSLSTFAGAGSLSTNYDRGSTGTINISAHDVQLHLLLHYYRS